jgi:hypothetical protein
MHHDLLNEVFTANCMEEEILDAPAVRDLWTDRDWLHTSLLDRWHELADELKHPEHHSSIALDLLPTEEDLATATDPLGWFEEEVNRGSVTLPAGTRIFTSPLRLSRKRLPYSPYSNARDGCATTCICDEARARESGRGELLLWC